MGSVVIDDGMDRLSLRHPRFDGVEEADELLMAVSFHVLPDDGAIEDIEGSKQRRGAMPFVVMRHRAGAARFHRQAWLGALERLDLALFVDREDHRMSGRVDVEADNVLEFLCELGIVRQLERSDAMGGELMGLKDALHRSQTHARRLRQHPAGPMAGFSRRRRERQIDHPLHRGRRQRRPAGRREPLVVRKATLASVLAKAASASGSTSTWNFMTVRSGSTTPARTPPYGYELPEMPPGRRSRLAPRGLEPRRHPSLA